MSPPSAVAFLILQIDRQAAASSLFSDLEKNHKLVKHSDNTEKMCLLIPRNPTHSLSLLKYCLKNLPSYFLNNPLKEDQSLKILGHTLRQDLS